MSDEIVEPTAIAEVVDSQVTKVQIPLGLKAGDSFIVTPENGRCFTVIVPEGALPGTFIQVIVPDETITEGDNNSQVKVDKATAGAAIAGGVVGGLLFGPIGFVVVGGAMAYATTRKKGKIGEVSRKIGNGTYNGGVKAKKWVEKQFKK